ncbi:MAG TPA: 3-methyl-2-oxobutanoate hydroxymethyltransferase [Chloroflexota bacterium]
MRTTIINVQRMKERGEKFPMVTAYDYTSAQLVDRAGIPIILVGDSLGMVVLGYDTTVQVTLDDMIRHSGAVSRGSANALIVADLPFLTYATPDDALRNAGRLVREGGAQAVKLEGGLQVVDIVHRLVDFGIPVMSHIGLTPQSVHQLGGMRIQGRKAKGARALLEAASALQDAGAFSVVLESVPLELAREVTSRLRIPTIGIGAGPACDGQVLVWHDLLGLYNDFVPRHTRRYAELADTIVDSLGRYATEVREGTFPAPEHASTMDVRELNQAVQTEGNGHSSAPVGEDTARTP